MFTGIVESIGIIQGVTTEAQCIHFIITPQCLFDDLMIGDSVSVNGVCLTVTQLIDNTFSATAVPETLRVTNLGELQQGSIVNLERSLKMNARLGGHYVQGHIDAVGHIIDIKKEDDLTLLATISLPESLSKYVVKKGYITLDGMSITVIDVTPTSFSVTWIPHTQQVTIVHRYQMGDRVNLEVDIMSKYIEKLLGVKA